MENNERNSKTNIETKDEILTKEEMNVDKQLEINSGLDKETILNIRRAYKLQKKEKKEDGSGWDFWEERLQIENLLCQRFNYLILCYSLFITAFAVIPDKSSKIILLSVGLVVMSLITVFVRRAWIKLDYNLKCLFVLRNKYNGIEMIDQYAAERGKRIDRILKRFNIQYNQIIGSIIPIFLCISLALGILAIALELWDGGATSNTTTSSCNNAQVIQSMAIPDGQSTHSDSDDVLLLGTNCTCSFCGY